MKKQTLKLLLLGLPSALEKTVLNMLGQCARLEPRCTLAANVPEAKSLLEHERFDVILAQLPVRPPVGQDQSETAAAFSLMPVLGISDSGGGEFVHPGLDDNIALVLPQTGLDADALEQGLCVALERAKLCRRVLASQTILHFTQRRLHNFMTDYADGIAVVDMDGRILFANPSAEQLFGAPTAELVGKLFGHPIRVGVPCEIEVLARDGKIKTVEMRAVQTRWGAGDLVYLASLRDISERKAMERELMAMKEAAEAANLAKNQFLANMSHEIRTPMNGILGMAKLLKEASLEPRQREYLDMLITSATSLTEILNDILDFSTIEAGKLELENTPFSLRQAVESAIGVYLASAREKGLTLSWHIHEGLPETMCGDAGRLRQVIMNLVGNAIKFTEYGEVRLQVLPASSVDNDDAAHVALRFSVIDTGPGIPQPKLDKIFESFTQADNSPTRKHYGTGLGLALCKSLVERMHGRIWAQSDPGRGSIFTFEARLGRIAQAERPLAASQAQPQLTPLPVLTILLAEDNLINQMFATEILEQDGHTVIPVTNGQEALDTLARQKVDAVLMDIQMPEMDGLEATRRIRSGKAPGVSPSLPIIAMTAHALKGDKERFLASGMDGYLSKPVSSEDIQDVLRQVLAKAHAAQQEAPPALKPLNEDWLLEKARGNREFLKKLIGVFVEQQPLKVQEMHTALTAGDMEGLAFMAHTLKGGAATMGAELLKERAFGVEKAAKASDLSQADRELSRLDQDFTVTLKAMREFAAR